MKKKITYKENNKQRLDKFLAHKLSKYSRNQIQDWISQGYVKINKEIIKENKHTLKHKDKISIAIPKEKPQKTQVDSPKIQILFEHKDFLIINKPVNLLIHPSNSKTANTEDSVAQQIVKLYPKIKKVGEDPLRPGIVHRLDKMVSGLIVVARNQKMFKHLKQQFKNREVKKTYLALVKGKVAKQQGEINFALGRSKSKKRMVALPQENTRENSKNAKTKFQLLKYYKNLSLLKVNIITGRTHQIRAHMHAFNHPIVGDHLYSNKRFKKTKLEQIFLHSYELKFKDLDNKEQLFIAPLNDYLKKYLNKLTLSKNLFVVSGASGVGKSAIIINLLKKYSTKLNLKAGTTYTTRELRNIAEDKEIIKVSEKKFKDLIRNEKVIEWAKVHKNYYGTAADILKKKLKKHNIILNIDIQGALKIQINIQKLG